jgi:Amt family ammonium transporter
VPRGGGAAGLVGAILGGPRTSLDAGEGGFVPRFAEDGSVNEVRTPSSSIPLSALGTLILWVGWYGFNPGSQFAIAGNTSSGFVVGLAMVNTTLAASASAFAYFLIGFVRAEPDLGGILNAALGGLVAITANCNCVESWAAVLIGLVAGFVYLGSSRLLKCYQIDDVIDASPVHFFCGLWGVIATGLFAATRLQGTHAPGLFYGSGQLLLWQFIGAIVITLWTVLLTVLCLGGMHYFEWLRISEEEEKIGLDKMCEKYGIAAVNTPESPSQKKRQLKLAEGKPIEALDIEQGPKDVGAPINAEVIQADEVIQAAGAAGAPAVNEEATVA